MSWFGNGPGVPGSCFPSMGSIASMDGSMHGGAMFGPLPPQLGSPEGSVHGASLAQQACAPTRVLVPLGRGLSSQAEVTQPRH